MGEIQSYFVPEESEGKRVDVFLCSSCDGLSRSYIQKLIETGAVTSLGKKMKSNYKLKAGEEICIKIPEPEALDIKPEDIPLSILYEDGDIIVVNKPQGMVVHPAAGHTSGTLVNALLFHCKGNLSGINGVLRPGIVHRIDMDTSGVLVVCKNDKAHHFIAEQLKVHSITRCYQAIAHGHFKEQTGIIDAPVGRHPVDRKKMAVNFKNGKSAITHYKVLEIFEKPYSYIECRLETGRTHQIRVHMASLNHPLLGDKVYGPTHCPYPLDGQMLHARILGLIHPSSHQYMEFEAALPETFEQMLERFR